MLQPQAKVVASRRLISQELIRRGDVFELAVVVFGQQPGSKPLSRVAAKVQVNMCWHCSHSLGTGFSCNALPALPLPATRPPNSYALLY